MKVYQGHQTPDTVMVTVDGAPLPPRLDLRRHTAAGFDWGHIGSGAAQLALALLADHLRDDGLALRGYMGLMAAVVAELPHDWTLTSADLDHWWFGRDDS